MPSRSGIITSNPRSSIEDARGCGAIRLEKIHSINKSGQSCGTLNNLIERHMLTNCDLHRGSADATRIYR